MEFLKNQFNRIQQQLGGLSASQRMLAGALVVIMVMTLMGWGTFAGRTEMEVLLDQPMQADEIATITTHLEARGIAAKVVGDRIQVPSEKRIEALADLVFNQLMPADTKNGFDDMFSKVSPFASNQTQQQMFLSAKQAVLGQIIRHFPRVSAASVIIDPSYERGLGGAEPRATVNIKLRSSEKPDQHLFAAAADLLAGAVARLDRSQVHVIVDGAS